MKLIVFSAIAALPLIARAEIGIMSPAEAKALIENPVAAKRPIVLDTRGGYKDYFRGHLPTAQHINFDTLRGTDQAVPVQYLPDDLTKALLVRAGVDRDRLHLVYATGAELPNDEILSASMVVYVLEKFGVKDIRIVDGGLAEWVKQGFEPARDYFGNPKGALPKTANPGIAANVSDVQKHAGKPGSVLVDARPINEFQGDDDVWLRKGHIPGAISFHWARLMEKDNTHKFRPLSEVKGRTGEGGHHQGQEHHRLLRHLARRQPAAILSQARGGLPERPALRRGVEGIRLAQGQVAPCRDRRRACREVTVYGACSGPFCAATSKRS